MLTPAPGGDRGVDRVGEAEIAGVAELVVDDDVVTGPGQQADAIEDRQPDWQCTQSRAGAHRADQQLMQRDVHRAGKCERAYSSLRRTSRTTSPAGRARRRLHEGRG